MKRSAFCELLRWSLEGPELTTGKFSICFSTKQNPVLSTSESGAFDDRIFDRKVTSWRSIGFRREVFAIFKLIRNDSNRRTLRWWETVIFASKVQMFANFRVSSAYAFFVQKKSKQIEVIRFETLVCNPMILGRHWAESGSCREAQIAVDWRQLPVCHSVNTATRAAVQAASWWLLVANESPSSTFKVDKSTAINCELSVCCRFEFHGEAKELPPESSRIPIHRTMTPPILLLLTHRSRQESWLTDLNRLARRESTALSRRRPPAYMKQTWNRCKSKKPLSHPLIDCEFPNHTAH